MARPCAAGDRRFGGQCVPPARPSDRLRLSADRAPRPSPADRLGRDPGRARLYAAKLRVPRDHFAELNDLGVAQLYGLSTQDCDEQREVAQRLHLPFALLSDARLEIQGALNLPTFGVDGMTLLKRLTMVLDHGVITKVLYPVFPPDRSAAEVVAWLRARRSS